MVHQSTDSLSNKLRFNRKKCTIAQIILGAAMNAITSIKDPLVVEARALNSPKSRQSRFLLEDVQSLRWAMDYGIEIAHVFFSEHFAADDWLPVLQEMHIPTYRCSDGIMKKINESKHLCPVIAVAKAPVRRRALTQPFILVLENLHDQGNIGTIIRTAAALGLKGVVTTGKSNDVYNKKTINASRGSVFQIDKQSYQDGAGAIAELKAQGYKIIATSPHGKTLQSMLSLNKSPIALLIGNETTGASEEALAMADEVVQIPMSHAVESLNAGVAAGISMYELNYKVVIAMLSDKVRQTLGRNLGVAHQLMQALLNQAVQSISPYSGAQARLLMIMVCDETMSRSQIEKDMGKQGEALDAFLAPLINDKLIAFDHAGAYSITPEGESFLAKMWSLIESIDDDVLSGFSAEEKEQFANFLRRIHENALALIKKA